MSPRQYMDAGLQFISHLAAHHGIEERYIFPVLSRRMPEFREGSGGEGESEGEGGDGRPAEMLLQQHQDIHKGMDAMEEYLRRCRGGEAELEMTVLRAVMDTWGAVLWRHLDQEVEALAAENVRRYFTIQEVRRIPM
jgi:hemerythrin-like domain-containing protein